MIRHCEKDNAADRVHCTAAGFRRAAWLPSLFGPGRRFPQPRAIFARRPEPAARSVETVAPLAAAAGVAVDASFGSATVADLAARVRDVVAAGAGPAVVCWHHDQIPALVAALGWPRGGAVLDPWPADDFDSLVEVRFDGRRVAGRAAHQGFPG